MLTFNLSTIFSARGVQNEYSLIRKLGIGHMAAHNLVNGKVRSVRLDHIEKICVALHSTPNDLLEWTPEDQAVKEDHPLFGLMRKERLDLLSEIRDLPLDKLKELKLKLDEWKEEG